MSIMGKIPLCAYKWHVNGLLGYNDNSLPLTLLKMD